MAKWTNKPEAVDNPQATARNQFNVFNPGGAFVGVYNFNGELTSPNNAVGNAVHSLADFMLGLIQTANYNLPQPLTGRRNWNIGG